MALPEAKAVTTLRCILLLRLSVLFYRSHSAEKVPKPKLQVAQSALSLVLSKKWLAKHPLTRADLDSERAYLKAADIGLAINEK
jgi:exopolyphosphatase/guanosine-5'-triphosphate,3'-diphosphate pyrophosphatase